MVGLAQPTTCPHCGRKLAVVTVEPAAGEPIVCGQCAAVCIYDDDGIRAPTDVELRELSPAQVSDIAFMQHAVRRFIRSRARSN